MIFNEAYTLANGMSIPKLGLGTWFIDDDKAAEAIRTAVNLGAVLDTLDHALKMMAGGGH